MYVAQIRRKLTREEAQLEDLLTSNAFGLWRYLPPEAGLRDFLASARNLDGEHLPLPEVIKSAHLDFWPWVQEGYVGGVEPDVLVHLEGPDDESWLIMVEAKYLSGKSSIATIDGTMPTDQLAREMLNLRQMARRMAIERYALVYVTADVSLPSPDLHEAINELEKKTQDGSSSCFYWISWRRLPEILAGKRRSCDNSTEIALLGDLITILDQLGLACFLGITSQGWSLGAPGWAFRRPLRTFDWAGLEVPGYDFSSTVGNGPGAITVIK